MSFGITFPFALSTGSIGYFESSEDITSALRSNVCSLLTTNWGERVMHTNLGCNMREFLFEPRTVSLKRAIHDRVRAQLAEWLPFLTLAGMFVRFSEEDPAVPPNGIQLELQVTYGNIPINVLLNFPNG